MQMINVGALAKGGKGAQEAARLLRIACTETGFFYATHHGVDASLEAALERHSKQFFALPPQERMAIRMAKGGKAWRGYFPVGEELTSGQPDLKEGLYFGAELGPRDPRVRAGLPLHGANLFPEQVPALREVVLKYMEELTRVAQTLMSGVALSLNLHRDFFKNRYTADPFVLFRIFHYPPVPPNEEGALGAGEHSDYGLLTLLKQDGAGLEVKSPVGWIAAPPVPGAYVCNIGDMLEQMTHGLYRSTPHRVLNRTGRSRLSWPFFFDPSFSARMEPLEIEADAPTPPDGTRWDGEDVHAFRGTYGDYLVSRVKRVFPLLGQELL